MSSFRFPAGVEFVGEGDDGHVHFSVDIPIDDDGYFGRECPSCEQHFRVAHEDYDACPMTWSSGASTAATTMTTATS